LDDRTDRHPELVVDDSSHAQFRRLSAGPQIAQRRAAPVGAQATHPSPTVRGHITHLFGHSCRRARRRRELFRPCSGSLAYPGFRIVGLGRHCVSRLPTSPATRRTTRCGRSPRRVAPRPEALQSIPTRIDVSSKTVPDGGPMFVKRYLGHSCGPVVEVLADTTRSCRISGRPVKYNRIAGTTRKSRRPLGFFRQVAGEIMLICCRDFRKAAQISQATILSSPPT
jgi:hypothetical protein